jgi:predicted secreted protein
MKRVGTAILLALALVAKPAAAGDGAALNMIGFSADGRYFAFEQYGEQDGSGTLYSIITTLEVASDRLVKGSPTTVTMDADDPKLGKEPRKVQLDRIRAKAAAEAAILFKQLGIVRAGNVVASARRSRSVLMLDAEDVKAARHAAVSNLSLPADSFGPDAQLVLRDFDIALPRCKHLVAGEHPSGFGLTLERKSRPTIHLHRDQTIPSARGCPDRYGLADAMALPLPDGSAALAVLIQYFYQGLEGPDRRFLAVTGRVVR